MNNHKQAIKSGLWYTISIFLVKGMSFLTTPIFSRMLTHAEFGLYSNFVSWMSVLTVLVTLNLESTFISAWYDFKKKFDEYVFSVLTLSTVSGLVWLLFGLVFLTNVTTYTHINERYLLCMILYLIALPAVNMYQARERYYFRYKSTVFLSLLIAVATTGASLLLVANMNDRLTGRVVGTVAPTIVIGAIIYTIIGIKGKRIKVSHWKYALPICLPFIPHLLSLSLLYSMDRMMITGLCSAEDTAMYSIAYTCGSIVTLLASAMNAAFAPWLGNRLDANETDVVSSAAKKYIGLFVVLAAGIMLLSPEVLLIMGGKNYLDAKYVMPPVAFGCVCQFLYTMYVNIEQFKKKTVGMAVASVSAAMLNYGLNAWAIPRFGYIAAAYTTLASFLWLLLVHMALVKKMKLSEIYPKRFIFVILALMTAYTVLVNYLYDVLWLRYSIAVLYITTIAIFIYKNRKTLLSVFKKS